MAKTKSNVVAFRHGTTSFLIPDELMTELRARLYNFDPKDAADFMGVSASTIYALRSGRTGWPRGKTMFKMLQLLELEIRLYSVKQQRYI